MAARTSTKKLIIPIVLLVVFSVPLLYVDTIAMKVGGGIVTTIEVFLEHFLGIAIWLAAAWVVIRIINVLILEVIVERKLGTTVPKLLKDLAAFLIFTFAIIGIIGGVFDYPVSGLLAATGAAGMMIAFALRNMIFDVFSGIAINIEHPFRIGDYVKLDSGTLGQVKEINWRTTIVQTFANVMVVVPNGRISTMEIQNFSRPAPHFRGEIDLHLDFNVPTERVLRILNAAARGIETGVKEKRADAQIVDIDELGVKYRVRFWCPDYPLIMPIRTKIIASVMHNLYQAGISPVHHKHDIYMTDMPVREFSEHKDQTELISRVKLFESLTAEEIESFCQHLKNRFMPSGETVVRENEEGDSLFILVEGLLQVKVKNQSAEGDIVIGTIKAGEFFGEFSLLTGERRSATIETMTDCVVYEVTKENIAPLLKGRPMLAKFLADYLAERKLKSSQRIESFGKEQEGEKKKELAGAILEKMIKVFTFLKKKPTD
jgi:small-conductance mechanosensitive channel/CRP-like cAMP-binding protein